LQIAISGKVITGAGSTCALSLEPCCCSAIMSPDLRIMQIHGFVTPSTQSNLFQYGGGFTFYYTKRFLNRFIPHVYRARPTHGPWTSSKKVRIWLKIEKSTFCWQPGKFRLLVLLHIPKYACWYESQCIA
jgi:hypothetical protein